MLNVWEIVKNIFSEGRGVTFLYAWRGAVIAQGKPANQMDACFGIILAPKTMPVLKFLCGKDKF